ncbi:haloacid dehalogenase-like hydrolase [Actinomadura fulvescens]|uniref:HAD family hydrolase n=1 Tax=Actinomadura fulvescens TaxID=46160 RepID=UPI0031DAAFD6
MSNLHIFDMDGTLLAGSTANLEVARQLGTLPELHALEARFAAGTLDTRGFSAAIHALWRTLTPAHVAAAYTAGPWLNGIADVTADIRRRGERSAVITMSPDFFAHHLLDLGFDEVAASRFPPPPFTAPLDPAGVLTPADKVRITDDLRTRYGLTHAQCVAYGDSMSDAPLFRHLTNTVAVNADHHLADIAAADYRGDDLTHAYHLGRALLDNPPAPHHTDPQRPRRPTRR